MADDGHAATSREVWLVFSTPRDGVPASAFETELAAHLAWMDGLDQQGLVLLAGPLLSGPGTRRGSGVALLRAADEPAARAIAEQDPFVLAGLRTFAVHRWRINEGSLESRVSFGGTPASGAEFSAPRGGAVRARGNDRA